MPTDSAATILYERTGGQWTWRCDGCWLGTGHPSYTEARTEAQRHVGNGHDRLRDWPCTNADHHGLCSSDHVHADHVVTGIHKDPATGGGRD